MMPRYRRIPVEVEAVRWFHNGDHPKDGPPEREGRVVRYYRHPNVLGGRKCTSCCYSMYEHGWIDQPGNVPAEQLVCPGNWIVTGYHGVYYIYNNTEFCAKYEPVE